MLKSRCRFVRSPALPPLEMSASRPHFEVSFAKPRFAPLRRQAHSSWSCPKLLAASLHPCQCHAHESCSLSTSTCSAFHSSSGWKMSCACSCGLSPFAVGFCGFSCTSRSPLVHQARVPPRGQFTADGRHLPGSRTSAPNMWHGKSSTYPVVPRDVL